MTLKELKPKQAADLLLKDPKAALIPFAEFLRFYEMEWEEMLKELQSGRLVACLAEGQYFVTAHHAMEWAVETGRLPPLETEH